MASMKDVAHGLLILARYGDDSAAVAAEHDVIYAGPVGTKGVGITEEDLRRLEELRWSWDEKQECWYRFV
jgi:hypothetical protein